MDDTHLKIMRAAMDLVTQKGYDSMTTKEIAKLAEVNESTLFRKFKGKEDIVLTAMNYEPWRPNIKKDMFKSYVGDLSVDLVKFAKIYLDNVTPYFVGLSIGLRTPQLYQKTSKKIISIPQNFLEGIKDYFLEMKSQNRIVTEDIEGLSVMFLSMCFGFVFFKASFEDELTSLQVDDYIKTSVEVFINGIKI